MHNQTGSKAIDRADRRATAIRLRREGKSLQEIADQLGIAVSTAHADVEQALKDVPADEVGMLRALWSERLDHMLQSVWEAATHGDLAAIDRVLKLAERAAKLHGLDAPQQVAIAGASDLDLDAAVRDLVAAAQAQPVDPPEWRQLIGEGVVGDE